MPLTDIDCRSAKPKEKAYRLHDHSGLYLEITPTGKKYWRWKYRVDGKERRLALGIYPTLSLREARDKCDHARSQLKGGVDPGADRRAARTAQLVGADTSFQSVATAWHTNWKQTRAGRHADYVLRRRQADAFPQIGHRPIDKIQPPELVRIMQSIHQRGAHDIARRVYQTCGQVFRYGIAHGLCSRNPTSDVKPSDILPARSKQNRARIDMRELGDLLRAIDIYSGRPSTRLAMKLLALTFVRTGELIGARWQEFDFAARQWRIPAERMKMGTEHIVHLCPQTIEVLRLLQMLQRQGRDDVDAVVLPQAGLPNNDLLFPGDRGAGKQMSNNTILKALERMGYKHRMTGHGFRGIASTLLHEHGFDHQHIELQLAHAARNAVSAAYDHAKHLAARARMMDWWGNYLEAVRTNANPAVDFPESAAPPSISLPHSGHEGSAPDHGRLQPEYQSYRSG